jgi:hypothetical protein
MVNFGNLGKYGGNALPKNPIRPLHLSTAGVHPLVKASMLPRIKAARAQGVVAQSNMLRSMARSNKLQPTSGTKNLLAGPKKMIMTPPGRVGGGKNQLDMQQLRSRRAMRGHAVPLSGKL